jgi:four helix bundle protein
MGMKFEDLEAWQKARSVVRRVYDLARSEGLKRDFGLCDQVQRSSVSVMTNIAEGFERIGRQEKLNFYNIARASGGETRSLLYVIEDNYPEFSIECIAIRDETIKVGRKITGLISSYKKRQAFITISALFTLAAVTSLVLFSS